MTAQRREGTELGIATNGLWRRRYLRALPPGILAGFASAVLDLSYHPFVGRTAHVPWPDILVAMLATLAASCAVGVAFALLFEAAFHLLLGTQPPAPLADRSDEARLGRRDIAVRLLTVGLCISGMALTAVAVRPHAAGVFANQLASSFAVTLAAIMPWWLVHAWMSRVLRKAARACPNLRRTACIVLVAVLAASWLVVFRLFDGAREVTRGVLSLEAAVVVFGFAWLTPHRRLCHLSGVIGIAALLSGTFLAIWGLSHPTRALLHRSHGPAELLVLRLFGAQDSAAKTRLRNSIASATQRALPQALSVLESSVFTNTAVGAVPSRSFTNGRPDIVMLTIDSLRPDRLGCYGSKLGITANLDEFCTRATVFSNAFAPAPSTILSLDQLMSGRPEHLMPHLLVASTDSLIVDPRTESRSLRYSFFSFP
jgi:hypothetical protein